MSGVREKGNGNEGCNILPPYSAADGVDYGQG